MLRPLMLYDILGPHPPNSGVQVGEDRRCRSLHDRRAVGARLRWLQHARTQSRCLLGTARHPRPESKALAQLLRRLCIAPPADWNCALQFPLFLLVLECGVEVERPT